MASLSARSFSAAGDTSAMSNSGKIAIVIAKRCFFTHRGWQPCALYTPRARAIPLLFRHHKDVLGDRLQDHAGDAGDAPHQGAAASGNPENSYAWLLSIATSIPAPTPRHHYSSPGGAASSFRSSTLHVAGTPRGSTRWSSSWRASPRSSATRGSWWSAFLRRLTTGAAGRAESVLLCGLRA